MGRVIDIVIPSLGKRRIVDCIASLTHIPDPYRIHLILNQRFEDGINEGIARSQSDILLMDDDVRIHPDTFKNFDKYYPHADIFGFKLLFENGTIQHGGIRYDNGSLGHYGYKEEDRGQCDTPQYVVGCTGALLYVKRRVIDALGGYATDYQGVQFVDVDFCLRAIELGFRILYIPAPAWHFEQFEKNYDALYMARLEENYEELKKRHFHLDALFSKYPMPCLI